MSKIEIEFIALIKEVKSKALVSLDKGFEVKLQGSDKIIAKLFDAPADQEVKFKAIWEIE